MRIEVLEKAGIGVITFAEKLGQRSVGQPAPLGLGRGGGGKIAYPVVIL